MVRLLVLTIAPVALASVGQAQGNPTLTEAERGIRRGDAPTGRLRIDPLDASARSADVMVEMLIASETQEEYEANRDEEGEAKPVATLNLGR